MTHLVFVYGTLLSGCGNHRVIARGERIGEAVTDASFHMVSLGGFPGVIDGGEQVIAGEVYRVDDVTLAGLDQLEGNGHFYTREERRVVTTAGEVFEAWIYLLPARYLDHEGIESGSWRTHVASRPRPTRRWWDEPATTADPEPDELLCEGCDSAPIEIHVLGLDLCESCARHFVCDVDDDSESEGAA